MIESRDAVGLATAAAACLLAIGAWRALRRGRPRLALAGLLAVAFLMRGFPASDSDLHEWDESYHALVAKHLAGHPSTPTLYDDPVLPYDASAWTRNHVWLHKQPLALWTMAASFRAFGVHVLAVRGPSVVLSVLSVAMTWFLGRVLGGTRVAFVAALLHAVNGASLALAAGRIPTDHVDTMCAVLVQGAMALAVALRARPDLGSALAVGGTLGLAALAKSPVALFALAPFAILRAPTVGSRRALAEAALATVVAAAVFAPWQIAAARKWPVEFGIERGYDLLHLTLPLEGHGGSPFFHLARLPRMFGEAAPFAILWFTLRVLDRRRDRSDRDLALERATLAWILIPYAFFSAVATKMSAYVFVAAPAIFLVVALATIRTFRVAAASTGGRRAAAFAAAVLLVALPVRAGLERMKPVGSGPWRSVWVEDLRAAERALAAPPPGVVAFNVRDPIRAMFHTSLVAYDRLPTPEDLAICAARGRRVLLWNDAALPDSLRRRADVLLWPPTFDASAGLP